MNSHLSHLSRIIRDRSFGVFEYEVNSQVISVNFSEGVFYGIETVIWSSEKSALDP